MTALKVFIHTNRKEKPMSTYPTKKPIQSIRDGRVSLAIWKNHSEDSPFYNVTIERTYTGKDSKPASSGSMGKHDLLRLQFMVADAYATIRHLENIDAAEAKAAADAPAPGVGA